MDLLLAAPPHPLKGIVNANDDPDRCALCYEELGERGGLECDGTEICKACDPNKSDSCVCCRTGTNGFRELKRQAKRGVPWAQYNLGCDYNHSIQSQSPYEAIRWFRKAAANGHPGAFLELAKHYRHGDGCQKDLAEAKTCIQRSLEHEGWFDEENGPWDELARIAAETYKEDREASEATLLTLAEGGIKAAQLGLTHLYDHHEEPAEALEWASVAAKGGWLVTPCLMIRCCGNLCLVAQQRFWLSVATKHPDSLNGCECEALIRCRTNMRELRQSCTVCNAPLDRSNRRLCKDCKTFCYCSRDCQKIHWNRSDDGHREECKEVKELKENLKGIKFKTDVY